jgi:hypothetical protein
MSRRLYALVAVVGIVVIVFIALSGGFSGGLSNFFTQEPDNTELLASPTATPSDQLVGLCNPKSTSITAGSAVTLRSRATTAQWFAPDGVPSEGSGASFDVSYVSPGTKKITVQIPRTDGSLGMDSGVCTVVVTP